MWTSRCGQWCDLTSTRLSIDGGTREEREVSFDYIQLWHTTVALEGTYMIHGGSVTSDGSYGVWPFQRKL